MVVYDLSHSFTKRHPWHRSLPLSEELLSSDESIRIRDACRLTFAHGVQEILYRHAAIRTAMEAFTAEARALQKRGGFTSAQLGALVDRHRFLRSVCTYHQASEDEVLFPAAK